MAQTKQNTQVTVVSSAQKYSITPVYSDLGKFSMTKQFTHRNSDISDMDLLDLLGTMSKGARDVFLLLKRNRDYSNNVSTIDSEISKSQLSRAYSELRGLNLVKRLPTTVPLDGSDISLKFKRGSYLINPEYIRLNQENSTTYTHVWNSIK